MGVQLTKEQARLPFGYVSAKSNNRRRITTSLTPRSNVHSSYADTPDSLLNDLNELNTHLQNMSNHLTLITQTGETASIITTVTDVIYPEGTTELDKSEDNMSSITWPQSHSHDHQCFHGIPDDLENHGGLSAIVFSELPNLKNIGLCSLGLVKLSQNICFLYVTNCLQICCNELTEIPAEIGYMKNLTKLDLSKNKLEYIPDTIGFLHKLVDLRLSHNQLTQIPSSIGSLKKLGTLFLDYNKITELPPEIGDIKTLVNLDVQENPITVLPSELGRLQYLRKLRTDGCPLKTEFVHDISHTPPTLMELAARTIVRKQIPILEDTTEHLKDYLSSAKKCSFCGGPYFESYVKRGKIIDKNDQHIPLEYRLCCPHWNTEKERLSLLFCALPDTAPCSEPYKHPNNNSNNSNYNNNNNNIDNDVNVITDINNTTTTLMASDSDSQKFERRKSARRSMTIPLSSLTRSPSLPSLPKSASPKPTSQLSDDVGIKTNNARGKNGISLWRSRKNSSASAILGKPRSSSNRLSSRWRS